MKSRIAMLCMVVLFMDFYSLIAAEMNGTLTPNASFLGTHYRERVGYALSPAGDMNGDHYDDFIIGTFHNHTGGQDAGAVYLILGRPIATWGLNYSLNNADARFIINERLHAVGFAIDGDGDVNGDGLSDIVIGAPAGNDQVQSRQGQLFVVLGDTAADWGFNCILSTSAAASYTGENGQDLAGRAVAILDDLNGDGCDEILCAAPYNDQGGVDAGKVYLIMGRKDDWRLNSKINVEASASFYYTKAYGTCGYSVANIGDVNDDGLGDFAIGAMGANLVFVMFGRPRVNWGANYNLNNADLIINSGKNNSLGWIVTGVGDVNGDQIDDFAMSAIDDNTGGTQAGKVFLVLGKAGGWGTQKLYLTDMNASYIGESGHDQAGWGLGGIGDVNDDGYHDFMIGAWKNTYGYPEAGKAYLIYGKPNDWQTEVSLRTVTTFFSGEADTNYAGYAVATAGDTDNDGWDDYIVSATYNSEVSTWSGKIYLFASQRLKYQVDGHVQYFSSKQPVQQTLMYIADSDSQITVPTDDQGYYETQLFGKTNYSLLPFKERHDDVGDDCVSAYDAAIVARHSVKLATINYPLTKSADVNLDGKINMYDAALILQESVGNQPPANSQIGAWFFEPDSLFITNLGANLSNQNFTALIGGDVDASWQPPSASLGKNTVISSTPPAIRQGSQLIVPIDIEANQQILSIDLRLKFYKQSLALIGVEKGQLGEHFTIAYHADDDGVLKIGAFSFNPVNAGGHFINIIFSGDNVEDESAVLLERMRINNEDLITTVTKQNQTITSFQLLQNYPNPFNGATEISYQLDRPGKVRISIYNTSGQEVYGMTADKKSPGNYSFSWNGADNWGRHVATGVYVCQAICRDMKRQIKLVYIK